MTEIDRGIPVGGLPHQELVDEYHPLSVGWKIDRIEWVIDSKNPDRFLKRSKGGLGDELNPQTGCG